ncbi:hypothetical protein HZB08_02700 [Candidatus Saganbacteria bacterium]|uniref:Lipoprotein n=1 Tax=Candidatus Saganbacteria bacterium TaxID=2575572 RepID=A0A9D6UKQ6_UNCSA|nr:hypothetical protein [Candidatus Saganbacteria bacterium]
MLRAISCLLLVVSCLLLVSCARSVTQIVNYGDQMAVEVTLAGTMDASANRYFLILSSTPDYKIPLPPPDNPSWEALEPGSQPQQGAAADYYSNFYATWTGYVIVEPGGCLLAKGPFVQNQTVSRETLSTLSEIDNKIRFNFRLDRVFGAAVPAQIYFDFISVPWPSGAAKIPADHLSSTNNYISKVSGSILTVNDEVNVSLDPARDIISCKVAVQ